ncbi:putative NRPS-like protein biosynthetic cluster [Sporothrix curviconia]|uniref:NRPS-like protein biosynthetic cluster n=1 Tax=Sporothrix curviconia TaxID=1260050 RepID=A0ABP0CPV9_9PEZI
MTTPHPDAGRRLLPHIADQVAADTPDRVLYEYPSSSSDLSKQWKTVTARQFADAVNRAAHWIRDTVGTAPSSPATFPRLGYSGPPDLRYYILVLAAIKAGYVMLYTSLRNSAEGDAAVLQAAGCTIWLEASRGTHIQRVVALGTVDLRLVALPEVSVFLTDDNANDSSNGTRVEPFPYTKTWDEGKRDPAWVLHTSGSTGHPKPVVRYLDSVAFAEANVLLRPIDGKPLLLHDIWSRRAYLGFPQFHAAGLNNGLLWPLSHGGTIVLGPPDLAVNTADVVADVIRAAKPDALYLPPSLLEDLAKDEATLALLGTVGAVGYAGGPLSFATGQKVAQHTVLHQGIGTTETGWLPTVLTAPEDWFYTHVHPDTGNTFQDRGGGLYELVAVRDARYAQWQPIFSTFPDLDTYEFRDLFSRHPNPAKPDLYRYEGRIDNVLVLSNGEKVQPQAMELAIVASPLVADALVVGQGRFQTAVLVQPAEAVDMADVSAFLDAIAPFIDEANRAAPAHAQIHANFVLVGSPSTKAFVRTGKGTVRRGPTIELYKTELDELYARAEEAAESSGPAVAFDSKETLNTSLREAVTALAKVDTVADDDDLFAAMGLDSLQVLSLRRQILRGVADAGKADVSSGITATLIYRNPSVSRLTDALWGLFTRSGQSSDDGSSSSVAAEQILQEYKRKLANIAKTTINGVNGADQTSKKPTVVVLTGSTGSLGSHLLNTLLKTPAVTEIWCLNRRADGGLQKQRELQARIGNVDDIDGAVAADRLYFRHARLNDGDLGLPVEDYARLQHTATLVLHTQWQVDFNLAVASFTPHIAGILGLAQLATAAHARLVFTSSVGVANRYARSVPEEFLSDFSVAGNGYGESKLVAELLLQQAAQDLGLSTTVVRVGQISGPVSTPGVWTPKEWFPSLVAYSAHAGIVPASLGRNEHVDWIPVDALARILLEVGLSSASPAATTLVHAVHPRPVTWAKALLPTVVQHLQKKNPKATTVPLEEWVARLTSDAQAANADEAHQETLQLSAFRLVPFLSGLASTTAPPRPHFATTRAVQKSQTLQLLPAIGSDSIETWLSQWSL